MAKPPASSRARRNVGMTGGTKLVPNPCHDQTVEAELVHQNPVEDRKACRHFRIRQRQVQPARCDRWMRQAQKRMGNAVQIGTVKRCVTTQTVLPPANASRRNQRVRQKSEMAQPRRWTTIASMSTTYPQTLTLSVFQPIFSHQPDKMAADPIVRKKRAMRE